MRSSRSALGWGFPCRSAKRLNQPTPAQYHSYQPAICKRTKHSVHTGYMTERDESYGAGLAELMNPEVARNPQPIYSMLQESSPVFRLDGVGVIVCSRSGVDEVLSNPDAFSSGVSAHDLKTKRPLIPLQVDPPGHRKYRKILDRLFAPQRMKLLEDSTTQLVNDLIDRFMDDREIDFSKQFSTPFPSQVFLGIFGLPMAELPRFLKMKDGVIRPDQVVGHEFGHPDTEAYQQQTADSIYTYFDHVIAQRRTGDEREDLISHFLHTEADDTRFSDEEILDICFLFLIAGLDTVTVGLLLWLPVRPSRRPSQDGRRSRGNSLHGRRAAPMGNTGHGVCPSRHS
jgi:cytochrome P450